MPTMDAIIAWITSTGLSAWVSSTPWVWPAGEILHFIGLSLLLGAILIADLRLAGFFKSISIATTHKLIPWAIAGFALNALTGVLFVFGDPQRYFVHTGFWIKMLLIAVAGLNALMFYWKVSPVMHSWAPEQEPIAIAKTIAFVSIGTWFAVLLLGRLIPYVSTG
jgi:hypothetical protein